MSMRSQIYAWNSQSTAGGTAVWANARTGTATSIFIGGFGNNITKPAETTATQFVVIEDVAVSPSGFLASGDAAGQYYRGLENGAENGVYGNRAYIQVRINTTDYFLDPDNVGNDGIPGAASPYPRSTDFQPCFNLYPDVYVLPGQVFQILYTPTLGTNDVSVTDAGNIVVMAFIKYTLYDGPDALIANKLLELGVTINPNNVDWYKRSLIEQQTRSAVAATAAAATNGGSA